MVVPYVGSSRLTHSDTMCVVKHDKNFVRIRHKIAQTKVRLQLRTFALSLSSATKCHLEVYTK